MGQQQLLLIVLSVIIVGIAVVVGISLFTAQSEESAKDSMISEGTRLGAMAQQYFKKPPEMGGGGNSFTNFTIPGSLDTTANATYAITTAGDDNDIVITGTPLESLGYDWTVVTTATPTEVTSVVSSGGAVSQGTN